MIGYGFYLGLELNYFKIIIILNVKEIRQRSVCLK